MLSSCGRERCERSISRMRSFALPEMLHFFPHSNGNSSRLLIWVAPMSRPTLTGYRRMGCLCS